MQSCWRFRIRSRCQLQTKLNTGDLYCHLAQTSSLNRYKCPSINKNVTYPETHTHRLEINIDYFGKPHAHRLKIKMDEKCRTCHEIYGFD